MRNTDKLGSKMEKHIEKTNYEEQAKFFYFNGLNLATRIANQQKLS